MKKKGASKIRPKEDQRWYTHYYKYLSQLTFQLFEWEGLPKTIDPRYLEMSLHSFGYVGFYDDPKLGYIVTQGALSVKINLIHITYTVEFLRSIINSCSLEIRQEN